MVHPGIHFKAVEGDTLFADPKLSQSGAYLPVKAVAVHAQVGWGIAEADQAGLDLQCLSAYVHSSNLFSDMALLFADCQAGLLVGLLLRQGQFLFGGPACMRRWPTGEFKIALLGIGVAQPVHPG